MNFLISDAMAEGGQAAQGGDPLQLIIMIGITFQDNHSQNMQIVMPVRFQ